MRERRETLKRKALDVVVELSVIPLKQTGQVHPSSHEDCVVDIYMHIILYIHVYHIHAYHVPVYI